MNCFPLFPLRRLFWNVNTLEYAIKLMRTSVLRCYAITLSYWVMVCSGDRYESHLQVEGYGSTLGKMWKKFDRNTEDERVSAEVTIKRYFKQNPMFHQPQTNHDINTIPSDINHNCKWLPWSMKKDSKERNIVFPLFPKKIRSVISVGQRWLTWYLASILTFH